MILDDVRVTGPTELETSAGERIEADRIVFAGGTRASLPPIDGLHDGPYWTNKEAIWHDGGVPSSLVVIGGGPIGVEFAQIYARFGARVTIVESFDRLLPPEDEDSAVALRAALEAEGISILTGATIESARHADGTWRLEIAGHDGLEAERVLVATGREPVLDGHDLDAAGVKLDDGNPVLDDTMRTTAGNMWAAGDATGELLFTHVGAYEAKLVVDDILGRPRTRDYRVVPKVTYSDPEVASVGLSEHAAREADHEVVTTTLLPKGQRARGHRRHAGGAREARRRSAHRRAARRAHRGRRRGRHDPRGGRRDGRRRAGAHGGRRDPRLSDGVRNGGRRLRASSPRHSAADAATPIT